MRSCEGHVSFVSLFWKIVAFIFLQNRTSAYSSLGSMGHLELLAFFG
jgi:hypothetical protein